MREKGDVTSARIFEEILEDEEHHIDYLETELGLIETLGEQPLPRPLRRAAVGADSDCQTPQARPTGRTRFAL